jgi:hypothetical protein
VDRRISLLVTVKAYPAVSQKYGEAVCVAGIRTDTDEPEWVRLFPVPFRDLPFSQRFKKYQHITVEASKHNHDLRPETYRPNLDTLETGELLDSKLGWAKRWPFIEPVIVDSMCEVLRQQKLDKTSLAAFRPGEVIDLLIDGEDASWSPEKEAVVSQPSLFLPTKNGLEKVPYRFRYRYQCGITRCKGHTQSMVDWELAESFRSWRNRYEEPVLLEKIRQRFLDQMCGPEKDTIFFVGNQLLHPIAFLVLGVFWPTTSL